MPRHRSRLSTENLTPAAVYVPVEGITNALSSYLVTNWFVELANCIRLRALGMAATAPSLLK